MTKLLQLSCCWRSNQVGGKVCAGFPNRGRVASLTSLLERSESLTIEYLWPPCAIQGFGVRSIVVANHNVVSHMTSTGAAGEGSTHQSVLRSGIEIGLLCCISLDGEDTKTVGLRASFINHLFLLSSLCIQTERPPSSRVTGDIKVCSPPRSDNHHCPTDHH